MQETHKYRQWAHSYTKWAGCSDVTKTHTPRSSKREEEEEEEDGKHGVERETGTESEYLSRCLGEGDQKQKLDARKETTEV